MSEVSGDSVLGGEALLYFYLKSNKSSFPTNGRESTLKN